MDFAFVQRCCGDDCNVVVWEMGDNVMVMVVLEMGDNVMVMVVLEMGDNVVYGGGD